MVQNTDKKYDRLTFHTTQTGLIADYLPGLYKTEAIVFSRKILLEIYLQKYLTTQRSAACPIKSPAEALRLPLRRSQELVWNDSFILTLSF